MIRLYASPMKSADFIGGYTIPMLIIAMAQVTVSVMAGMIVMLIKGADFFVSGASAVAKKLKVPSIFIGLTIVALGTSLPELCASAVAAKKGKADIAIGNIVGSNLFNILFVVGTSALIVPVPFQSAFRIDMAVAIGAAVMLFLFSLKDKCLKRWAGITLLIGYAGYFVYLIK